MRWFDEATQMPAPPWSSTPSIGHDIWSFGSRRFTACIDGFLAARMDGLCHGQMIEIGEVIKIKGELDDRLPSCQGQWVAELECGHNQHVRHDPPYVERPWVVTEHGRRSRLGHELNCVRCDEDRCATTEASAVSTFGPPRN